MRWPVLLMVRELGGGGNERQTAELAMALDRTCFEPHAACFHEGARADELRRAGIPVLRLPVKSFRSPSVLRAVRQFHEYVRKHGIQLIHGFDYTMNVFAAATGRAGGSRIVLTSQRSYREYTPFAYRQLLRLTDQTTDGIVVNSYDLFRHMVEDERVPRGRLHVCWNAVDLDTFHPAPRPAAAGLVVGTVSMLRPEKGHRLLLEAFALIRRPGLRLRIVGDGSAAPDLRALAARLGIETDCEFLPATAQVAGHMRSIDIFVQPSLTEGLSNALLEAMACGCCVVASDLPGNAEAAPHMRCGLLFRRGDAAHLAGTLSLALEDRELRVRLAAEAVDRVNREFSRAAAGRRLGEIYSSYLEKL